MTASSCGDTLVQSLALVAVPFVAPFTGAVALVARKKATMSSQTFTLLMLLHYLFIVGLITRHKKLSFRVISEQVLGSAAGLRDFSNLSRSNIDAGGVGMAAPPGRTVAVVDWLTLISIFPPSSQTLADVRVRSCLYTFGLQGAHTHTELTRTRLKPDSVHTYIRTAAASVRGRTRVGLHTGDPVTLVTRFANAPTSRKE